MPNKGYATVNTKTNKLQGIDMSGGGYPFDTDDIQRVKIWHTRLEAVRYLNTGLRKERNLVLAEITLSYEYEIIEEAKEQLSMNVQQLIDELQKIEDKNLPVVVYDIRGGKLELRDLRITKEELWASDGTTVSAIVIDPAYYRR